MKWRLFRVIALIAIVFASVWGVFAPAAMAQGSTPPTLPSLDEWLKMPLGALGAFLCVTLFGYYWGYWVSGFASRVAWNVPAWVWDVAILVPTAAVAAAWNAFAGFIGGAFPGWMDKTIGEGLLWFANYLMSLFFSRRGGLANLADVTRWAHAGSEHANTVMTMTQRARRGVLLLG